MTRRYEPTFAPVELAKTALYCSPDMGRVVSAYYTDDEQARAAAAEWWHAFARELAAYRPPDMLTVADRWKAAELGAQRWKQEPTAPGASLIAAVDAAARPRPGRIAERVNRPC